MKNDPSDAGPAKRITTYKQALRGLFTGGTSQVTAAPAKVIQLGKSVRHATVRQTETEKVSSKQGLNSDSSSGCPYNHSGA